MEFVVDFRNDHFSKVFADPPDPFPAPSEAKKKVFKERTNPDGNLTVLLD